MAPYYTIELQDTYIGLDVCCQTGEVRGVSGLCAQKLWQSSASRAPECGYGKLIAICDSEAPPRGIACEYGGDWGIEYDKTGGWLHIADHSEKARRAAASASAAFIQFAVDTIACVCESRLCDIWIKPVMLP